MKKLISLIVVFNMLQFLPILLNSCEDKVVSAVKALDEGGITYLLCGFDDAAENTDSMMLVNYSFSSNEIHFIQIPRDTYFEYKGHTRINSVYPLLRSSGKTPHEAMESLRLILSRALGIEIDAYVGYSSKAISNLIDDIGGVTVDLPKKFEIKSNDGTVLLSLNSGKNKIGGDDAIKFIRSRNTYLMGDIGRLDAQKFFISALLKEVKYNLGVNDIMNIVTGDGEGWVISCKIADFLKIVLKNGGRLSNVSAKYTNIPGAVAKTEDGVWYYSLCAGNCTRTFAELGMRYLGTFDPDKAFRADAGNFATIYDGDNYSTKIYDDSSLRGLDIKMK